MGVHCFVFFKSDYRLPPKSIGIESFINHTLTSAVIHILHLLQYYDFQALKEAVFLYLIKNETKVKFSIVV